MPDHPSSLTGAFRRPFTHQIAFWRRKLGNLIPTQRWDDIEQEAHDRAFMVAGAQKADLLSDLAAAVDRAIAEGTSLDTFRRDFRAIVERRGWHGWAGEGTIAGEAWRVRTIYRTNAKTSYAAGRMAQLREAGFPLWVYHHGGSREPREQHLRDFNGLVLPADHEFWSIFYPPSGWGCSCYVTGARSERAARRLGGDPDKKLKADWNRPDPATGLPRGVERGWAYAPGASVSDEVSAIAEKIRHWDHRIAKGFMEEVPARFRDQLARSYRNLPSVAEDLERYARAVLDGAAGEPIAPARTLGLVTGPQAGQIGAADVALFDFSIDPSAIRHVLARHGDAAVEALSGQRPAGAADYGRLARLLNLDGPIEAAGTSWRTGNPLIRIVRRIDGEIWDVVFEVRAGRRTLALDSLVIRGVRQP